ncbi:hypothetical protein E1294_31600 [Nonomuraea diastatica]|uniref:Uncharacterized protein n=1 Tax=Nonomuraea diastatica TaxID=1848329 RepID=A0A4R4WBZ7_9ACTN|nr:hypothetical protein E1294_31600 [Nonomuraea diastatica]
MPPAPVPAPPPPHAPVAAAAARVPAAPRNPRRVIALIGPAFHPAAVNGLLNIVAAWQSHSCHAACRAARLSFNSVASAWRLNDRGDTT